MLIGLVYPFLLFQSTTLAFSTVMEILQFPVLKTPLFCGFFAQVVLDETGSKEYVSHQEIDHAAGYNTALNSGEPIVLLVQVQPGTFRL